MVFITMLIEADGQDSTKYKVFGPVSCTNESGEAVQPVGTWHPTGKSSEPQAARPQTREMLNEDHGTDMSRFGIHRSCLPSCLRAQGAEVVECACMIELKALNGVGKLHERHPDVPVWSLISEDILTVKGEETS